MPLYTIIFNLCEIVFTETRAYLNNEDKRPIKITQLPTWQHKQCVKPVVMQKYLEGYKNGLLQTLEIPYLSGSA